MILSEDADHWNCIAELGPSTMQMRTTQIQGSNDDTFAALGRGRPCSQSGLHAIALPIPITFEWARAVSVRAVPGLSNRFSAFLTPNTLNGLLSCREL